ncbi:MAG: hypothetical protein WAT78_08685 [Rhizobiaceae bacterium]
MTAAAMSTATNTTSRKIAPGLVFSSIKGCALTTAGWADDFTLLLPLAIMSLKIAPAMLESQFGPGKKAGLAAKDKKCSRTSASH